jgi:hypothetical protein
VNEPFRSWLNDVPPLDWSNFCEASAIAIQVLERLATDRDLMSTLTHRVLGDERLFGLCEQHALDDKIVIHDALEAQNFRIRWRLAADSEYERVHHHRFSFATHVLRGTHHETIYRNSKTDQSVEEARLEDFVPVAHKECVAGQSFAIHHGGFHSTTTSGEAIGLLLRGPAEHRQALIIKKDDGRAWYRIGADEETKDRRESVAMSRAALESWLNRLAEQNLIDPAVELSR